MLLVMDALIYCRAAKQLFILIHGCKHPCVRFGSRMRPCATRLALARWNMPALSRPSAPTNLTLHEATDINFRSLA